METRAIILAAGKGTRMKSALPKVLHRVCGKTVLNCVLDVCSSLTTYVVVGHGADDVKKTIGSSVQYVLQDKLLGTGDAVKRVEPLLKNFNGTVLVLCGDTPLLQKDVVNKLLAKHKQTKAAATVLTALVDEPHGYGRIIRDAAGNIVAIREQKDATPAEDMINEINVGMYCFESKKLFAALKKIKLNPIKKNFI
jgi:bifunctional UDP-N-acetylglucosamine pyrophosphorylase / glucosamine-1-phosphate N-acetyltransferase